MTKSNTRVKNLTSEWNQKYQHFFPNAYRSLLYIQFVAVAFQTTLKKSEEQGYLAERLKSSFRKFYGRYGDLIQQYEVSLSRMLNDILILDQQWLSNQSDFPPISWPWYRALPSPIMDGFHGAFATGVTCQQGTLTLPDTWFRPLFWDLLMLQLLRPNSSNLPCLYSTFHLEYPLVLSRFYLEKASSLTNYGPALDPPLGGFGPKVNTNVRGFLSTLSLPSLVNTHQAIL